MLLLRLLLLLYLLILPLVQTHHLKPSLHGPGINQPTLGGHAFPQWILKHFSRRPLRDQVWLLLVGVKCRFILFACIYLARLLHLAQMLTRQLRLSLPEDYQEAGRQTKVLGRAGEGMARSQERWLSYLLPPTSCSCSRWDRRLVRKREKEMEEKWRRRLT